MLSLVISGVIGGIISSIFFPFISYWGLRRFNSSRLKINIDPQDPLLLRIENNSLASIKNAVGYIQIDFEDHDILKLGYGLERFLQKPSTQFMMLAWARNVDGKISPIQDIHQGETPDLSVLRISGGDGSGLIVSSENGLSGEKPIRIILNVTKDYHFKIKLTGENILPIIKKYKFDSKNKVIKGSE